MGAEAASLDAIGEVYRSRGASFLRLALARTGDIDRARDALQEGFARAIRSRATFRGSGSVEAWIARCVINAARDARRNSSPDGAAASVAHPAADTQTDAGSLIVREAVMRLPRRQRDALFLRYYLDFDYRTIAETLGIEVGAVSATLHAARRALGEALEEVQG